MRNSLSNLKSKVDKVDADKFVFVFVDLSKLSDVVKKMYIKMKKILKIKYQILIN